MSPMLHYHWSFLVTQTANMCYLVITNVIEYFFASKYVV